MNDTLPIVNFHDLGLIPYVQAWDFQKQLMVSIQEQKKGQSIPESHLIFCAHPHVYTLGKSGNRDHLLLNEDQRIEKGVEYYEINRGGDITYHGPGQIIGYPVFDMDQFFNDVHKYVRYLEEAVIRTCNHFQVHTTRCEGLTGVWCPPEKDQPWRKICAIGVHMSRWVTQHGFAFNVNTDLNYFKHIIPCGIQDQNRTVTSLDCEVLDREISYNQVKSILFKEMESIFGFHTTIPEKLFPNV